MWTSTRKLMMLTAKLAVCGGAVYGTAQQGVWADSNTSQHTYEWLRSQSPDLSPYLPNGLDLPDTSEMRRAVSLVWNWAVLGGTELAGRTPQLTVDAAGRLWHLANSLLVVTPEQVRSKHTATGSDNECDVTVAQ